MTYRSISKRVGNAVRLAELIQILVRHGFADLVHRIRLHEKLPARVLRRIRILEHPSSRPETLGARLRAALVELGPTFIKFGQVLSTRPDLVGVRISEELGLLQDRVAARPFDVMRPVIEFAANAPLAEAFSEFHEEPVASASLSQVYFARLRTGQPVAVKVQRPSIREAIAADISLLQTVAEWMTEHVQELNWLEPSGTVDEFERAITRELDFTIEARTIERFRRNFANVPTVFVPRTYPELSNEFVLVMDWVDGVRIDRLDAFDDRNCHPTVVARTGCDALCRQVFDHRLFHADPHPGNIFILRDDRIAFLDYGMVGYLERTDVHAMADLLRAVFREDSKGCVQAMLTFTVSGEVEDREALEHEAAQYLAFEAQAFVGAGRVGAAIDHATSLLRRHRLQLAPRFSLLMKALATIESTGHRLDPELDMTPIIRPRVERMIAARYSPFQLFSELSHDLVALLRLGRDMPQDILNLLRMARRGTLKVQLHHEGLNHLAAVTDRASNRIAFGVITGSIIVGSSMLISAEKAQTLGLAGYIVAGLLGLWLAFSILRSKNL